MFCQGADVFRSLSRLKANGVALRIVQNPPNKENPNVDSKTLQDKGLAKVQSLNVNRLIGAGILHTKLWVVDQRHFYLGSANMDWRSLTQVLILLCGCGLWVPAHIVAVVYYGM